MVMWSDAINCLLMFSRGSDSMLTSHAIDYIDSIFDRLKKKNI